MSTNIPIYIENDVIPSLTRYCAERQHNRFLLVADQNTYPVLGQTVEQALKSQGADIITVILTGDEVVPDEQFLIQVLVNADPQPRTYVAVGSGTITDITRFCSHRTRTSFISVPTAPSVDGFTSIGAPLVIGGLKQTVIAQPPEAVFANLPTLCAAPQAMIASGFGDMLGKFTSSADWELGHLLWDEPYDAAIAARSRRAAQNCADQAAGLGRADGESVRILMDSLIESGFCMLDSGGSRPASGMEHHVSHHLEMKIAWDKLPAVLHGAKVGVATLTTAGYYEQIRQMTPQEAQKRLQATPQPDRAADIELIKTVYPPIAEQIIPTQLPFLDLSVQEYAQWQQKIVANWAQVQAIAATVPSVSTLTGWYNLVGAATDITALGLSRAEYARAVKYSHLIRDRFTVAKLSRMLGIL